MMKAVKVKCVRNPTSYRFITEGKVYDVVEEESDRYSIRVKEGIFKYPKFLFDIVEATETIERFEHQETIEVGSEWQRKVYPEKEKSIFACFVLDELVIYSPEKAIAEDFISGKKKSHSYEVMEKNYFLAMYEPVKTPFSCVGYANIYLNKTTGKTEFGMICESRATCEKHICTYPHELLDTIEIKWAKTVQVRTGKVKVD